MNKQKPEMIRDNKKPGMTVEIELVQMNKQKPEIIRDNKKRGEWAEAVFAARAAENGLAVSKPSGDSAQFDFVVGHPGRFVAVQVKCTIAKQHNTTQKATSAI